ncbi:MAG: hypothetical protein CMM58_07360 [Rhodospirillaceae bacterium]|nr:hypothetical protein [Rhodospirillaceae bacterium]|tara:strand:- start:192 stop:584 length:393 start_codon:yes stop_codon:yes gene_type:complete
MDDSLAILGIVFAGIVMIALFSAVFAILTVVGMILGSIFFVVIIFKNIESYALIDFMFLSPLAGLCVVVVAIFLGLCTIFPFRIYGPEKPSFMLRLLNILGLSLVILVGCVWWGLEKITLIHKQLPTILI